MSARGRAARGTARRWLVAVAQAVVLATGIVASVASPAPAQEFVPPGAGTLREGRFTVIAYPSEMRLARTFLAAAMAQDSFPGLPRPAAAVLIAIAPDERRFREWVGEGAPEWGEAIAFPRAQRIVMRGRDAAAAGGDPRVTLRHELAHLALYEALGPGVPRWFDEGYASFAAGEWGRDEVLATSFGLVWRGLPTLDGLDSGFYRGSQTAQRSYALAHRAVAELATLSPERGLALLFDHWRREGSFERALRRAHGMSTVDFEAHWRSRVRRQFGALALAADLSLLAFGLTVLLGPLWWQRRARTRRRLERLREADREASERERTGALAALLGETGSVPGDDDRIKGS
ncbi:MAG: hypothetical protein WD771_08135 [Gemmatimonadaceae bacterium]